jgi:hypothetical protein
MQACSRYGEMTNGLKPEIKKRLGTLTLDRSIILK